MGFLGEGLLCNEKNDWGTIQVLEMVKEWVCLLACGDLCW